MPAGGEMAWSFMSFTAAVSHITGRRTGEARFAYSIG